MLVIFSRNKRDSEATLFYTGEQASPVFGMKE